MNLSEVLELPSNCVSRFYLAQRKAEHDGSDGEVYACTGDRYFPVLEFMSRSSVQFFEKWLEENANGADGLWDCVELVNLDD